MYILSAYIMGSPVMWKVHQKHAMTLDTRVQGIFMIMHIWPHDCDAYHLYMSSMHTSHWKACLITSKIKFSACQSLQLFNWLNLTNYALIWETRCIAPMYRLYTLVTWCKIIKNLMCLGHACPRSEGDLGTFLQIWHHGWVKRLIIRVIDALHSKNPCHKSQKARKHTCRTHTNRLTING